MGHHDQLVHAVGIHVPDLDVAEALLLSADLGRPERLCLPAAELSSPHLEVGHVGRDREDSRLTEGRLPPHGLVEDVAARDLVVLGLGLTTLGGLPFDGVRLHVGPIDHRPLIPSRLEVDDRPDGALLAVHAAEDDFSLVSAELELDVLGLSRDDLLAPLGLLPFGSRRWRAHEHHRGRRRLTAAREDRLRQDQAGCVPTATTTRGQEEAGGEAENEGRSGAHGGFREGLGKGSLASRPYPAAPMPTGRLTLRLAGGSGSTGGTSEKRTRTAEATRSRSLRVRSGGPSGGATSEPGVRRRPRCRPSRAGRGTARATRPRACPPPACSGSSTSPAAAWRPGSTRCGRPTGDRRGSRGRARG